MSIKIVITPTYESPNSLRITARYLNDFADNLQQEEKDRPVINLPQQSVPCDGSGISGGESFGYKVDECLEPVCASVNPKHAIDTDLCNKDISGAYWNSDFHASTKTKTKEGLWVKKRNYKNSSAVQVPIHSDITNTSQSPDAFPKLMEKITRLTQTNQLSITQILDAVKSVGLSKIPEIPHHLHLVPLISDALDKMLAPPNREDV